MTGRLLEVADLTAAYGPVQVLFGLDLVVNPGEFVVMLGANGAGKTTTLRALSGLVSASGTMNFKGKSILGDRADKVAKVGIAHVPQGRGTLSDLTVEENLIAATYALTGRKAAKADFDLVYEYFPRLHERSRSGLKNGTPSTSPPADSSWLLGATHASYATAPNWRF